MHSSTSVLCIKRFVDGLRLFRHCHHTSHQPHQRALHVQVHAQRLQALTSQPQKWCNLTPCTFKECSAKTKPYKEVMIDTCRKARNQLAQRPWRVDDLDAFSNRWFGKSGDKADGQPKALFSI